LRTAGIIVHPEDQNLTNALEHSVEKENGGKAKKGKAKKVQSQTEAQL